MLGLLSRKHPPRPLYGRMQGTDTQYREERGQRRTNPLPPHLKSVGMQTRTTTKMEVHLNYTSTWAYKGPLQVHCRAAGSNPATTGP